VTAVLLDTHVIHWWSAEPEKLARDARKQIEAADNLCVADISWFELAWLARQERIVVSIPVGSWLRGLSEHVRTVAVSPDIAATAAALPSTFPGDPADRLIYATAVENGWRLITKDGRLRGYRHSRDVVVW
jgi:PIN domain nuclease of toxin-antitoxin system